jgi:hypothetical protein
MGSLAIISPMCSVKEMTITSSVFLFLAQILKKLVKALMNKK